MPLPSHDLQGTNGLRATYSDAVGLTRSFLTSLTVEGGEEALLSDAAARFWTEHSDRAGCSGWCASLGIGTDRRGFLGRWAVASSADGYVRTALRE